MFRELALAAKVYHERGELPSLMRYIHAMHIFAKKKKRGELVPQVRGLFAAMIFCFSRGYLIQNKVRQL